MKKRLSLLLAIMMIVTLLPVSSFADAEVVNTGSTIIDTDTVKKVHVEFKFNKDFQPRKGNIQFTLNNAALARVYDKDVHEYYVANPSGTTPPALPNAAMNRIAKLPDNPLAQSYTNRYFAPILGGDVTAGALAATIESSEAVNFAPDVTVADDTTWLVKFAADAGAPSANADGRYNLEFDLWLDTELSNEGDITLDIRDYGDGTNGGTGFGNKSSVKIATVKYDNKALDVTAKEPDKEISYSGGEIGRIDIRNAYDKTGKAEFLALDLEEAGYYTWEFGLPAGQFVKNTKILVDGKEATLEGFVPDSDAAISITHGADPINYKVSEDRYVIFFDNRDLKNKNLITIVPTIAKMGRWAGEGNVILTAKQIKQNKSAVSYAGYKKGDYLTLESDTQQIAKVVDYAVKMTVVEKGKSAIPSIWAGEHTTVTVTLTGPRGTFSDRGVEFDVDGIEVIKGSIKVRQVVPGNATDVKVTGWQEDKDKYNNAAYLDGKFVITGIHQDTTKIVFDVQLQSEHDDNGTAVIIAGQRGWEQKADAAKITPKFTIATKATDTRKGEIKDQENIVITEAAAGLLRPNEKLTLVFDAHKDYISFTRKPKIEATNGMEFKDITLLSQHELIKKYGTTDPLVEKLLKWNGTLEGINQKVAVEFRITKASKGSPAVITVSDVNVRVDGSIADDTYPIWAGLNGYSVTKADYVKAVKEYAMQPVSTVFTIGQTQYTVNGVAKTANAAPYVKNGRTMLPVRVLAESLGLDVQWNQGTKTATFTDATKVAAVVVGAKVIHVNGTPIKLNATAEVVNGTIFIELRSLATAFGVQIDWDAAAKTATVSK